MTDSRTVILGGGFGGLAVANTLRGLLPAEHTVTVVDRTRDFYIGAGKTWIMLGQRTFDQISQPRTTLLEPGVDFVLADVLGLNLNEHTVTTGEGVFPWDYLVIALGADLNPASVPGLAEAAHTFYSVAGAQRLRGVLENFRGGHVVILIPRLPFKCPPAPYEAAMLLQEYLAQRGLASTSPVTVITAEGAPMPTAGPAMGQYILAALAQRGIEFVGQKKTVQVDGDTRRIVFDDGSSAGYDLLLVVPPHEAPRVIREAGLTNASGWIPVDPQTLHVQSSSNVSGVYAVGDVTTLPLPGRYKPDVPLALPKAGVFAEAQGRVVASQIASSILGLAASEVFDGQGFCYLETGGGEAVKAEGSFFASPHPVMHTRAPDGAQLQDKLQWVAEHLGLPR